MSLGARLKKKRVEKKLTQKELAYKLELNHTTISKWESDIYEPDTESLKKISLLLEVSIDDLLGNMYTDNEKELTEDLLTSKKIEDIKHKYDIDVTNLTDREWKEIAAYVRVSRAGKKE